MTEKQETQETQEKRIPILDDCIEGLEGAANLIDARVNYYRDALQGLVDGTLGVIYDLINQTGIDARTAPKRFVLDYLSDLVERGVTPDKALEFIADCEHDKLPDAPTRFQRFLDRCGELITDVGPMVFAQLEPLKDALVDLIAEMVKEGNGEATMADVIAKAQAAFDTLRTPSTENDVGGAVEPLEPCIVAGVDFNIVRNIGNDLRRKKACFINSATMEYMPEDMQPMSYDVALEECAAGRQNCHVCPDLTCEDSLWLNDLVTKLHQGLITDPKVASVIVALAAEVLDEPILCRDANMVGVVSTDKPAIDPDDSEE